MCPWQSIDVGPTPCGELFVHQSGRRMQVRHFSNHELMSDECFLSQSRISDIRESFAIHLLDFGGFVRCRIASPGLLKKMPGTCQNSRPQSTSDRLALVFLLSIVSILLNSYRYLASYSILTTPQGIIPWAHFFAQLS